MLKNVVVGLSASALLFAGCGGLPEQTTVKGKVSNEQGTQNQGLSSGLFAGQGTVGSAATVEAHSVGPTGSIAVVATAKVEASGAYELKVLPGLSKLVLQAKDSSGKVVASTILETSTSATSAISATPMDSESSVEAEVFLELLKLTTPAEANPIDLRARINKQVALAVKKVKDDGQDATVKVKALAEAVASAQRAQVQSYGKAGVTVSQDQLFQAQVSAALALSAALDKGEDAKASYEAFFTGLEAAAEAKGAKAQQRAEAESAASVSFRATVRVRASSTGNSDPVADAAIRSAASLEARASQKAITAALTAGQAAQASLTAATTAATTYSTELAAAVDGAAAAAAATKYQVAITGSSDIEGSVLGTHLGVTLTTKVAANGSLTAVRTAAATLNAALKSATELSVGAAGAVNVLAYSEAVANAYATYRTAVKGQASALTVFGAKTDSALDIMLVTEGSLRTAQ